MLQKPSPLFVLKDAGIRRNGRWLVKGVDLELHQGEIVTLIGPNGSGKSTTAKMALGILKPDHGSVRLGEGVTVSYVPQRVEIDWTLPLNVGRFMRLTGKLSESSVDEALSATGVLHLKRQEVRSLSGGEFQRVLLARAMARKPQLMVLDEPVQGVDFTGEMALYGLIQQIREDLQCGILLISHDLHIVMAATDRVVCMNGHVCCSGAPSTVIANADYKALFGDKAAGAIAIYEHSHDHTHHADGSLAVSDDRKEHDQHAG